MRVLYIYMSSSRNFCDGRRREKAAPEKTNFAQTCSLLSRYINEKGSLRDLNFEIGGKVESLEDLVSVKPASASTTNVLPNKGKLAQPSSEKHTSLRSSIIIVEDGANEASTSREETRKVAKNAQLTIFYSGKVLVFDDYSVDNIRELVSVAKKGSSKMSYGILSTNTLQQKPNPGGSSREGLPPRPQAGNSLNTCKEKINCTADRDVASTSISDEQLSTQSDANGSDLPIARRSSVHRFMEKRKERAVMRGPYQNQEQRPASSSKGDQQFDLNT